MTDRIAQLEKAKNEKSRRLANVSARPLPTDFIFDQLQLYNRANFCKKLNYTSISRGSAAQKKGRHGP